MKILVCGARGFIGAAICARLERDGHQVIRGVRDPAGPGEWAIDYTTDLDTERWLRRLGEMKVDVVINAVGIIIERGAQTFERIHTLAPNALFAACEAAGVRRVLQISALGAESGETPYFESKRAADRFLLAQGVPAHVIRPALVYGPAGTSARMFRTLASIPVHALPAGGHQKLRPVHIDDLAEVVARLLDPTMAIDDQQCIEVVGNTEVSYRDMLRTYRASMDLPPAWACAVPGWIMRAAASIGALVPGSPLTRDTWRMLQRGSTADVAQTAAVLGRQPQGIETFIAPHVAAALCNEALATWRARLLKGALAIVWGGAAFVSAFVYPRDASLALLSRVGLHGIAADVALFGACALDLGFCVATLAKPGRRLWIAQIALVLAYTAIVSAAMPEFLAEPFGPILKNVPILAILILLLGEEKKP
jgi:uncharacterized protein YbjT (DUF2867 family)